MNRDLFSIFRHVFPNPWKVRQSRHPGKALRKTPLPKGKHSQKQKRSLVFPYYSVLIGMSLSTGSLFLWWALQTAETAHIQQSIVQKTAAINTEITEEVEPQILSLVRMARHWEQEGGLRQTDWEVEARMNLEDFGGYTAIVWIYPSSDVRWVMPHEYIANLETWAFQQDPQVQLALEQARQTNQLVITPCITGIGGSKTFIAVVPIVEGDRLTGYVAGIFDAEMLFDRLLDDRDIQNYSIRTFSDGTMLYGRNNIEQVTHPWLIQESTIGVYQLNWQLQVAPTQALWQQSQTYLPEVSLLSGLGLSWLLALATYLIRRSDRTAKNARAIAAQLKATNQDLETEIQDRQQTEKLLQSTQKRLEHLLRCSPTVIYSFNLIEHYEMTFVSQNVTQIFGYDPQDFLDDPNFWMNHIHPDDAPEVVAALPKLFNREELSYEYRFLHKDGSYRWVYDHLRVVRNKTVIGIEAVGSMQDITYRKQAEEEIRQAQKFLQTVVENVPVALFVKDGRPDYFGQFKLWNKASERIFGIPIDEAIGATDRDFFPPEQAIFFREKDIQTFAQKTLEDIPEELVYSRDLGDRILHTIKVPIFNEQQEPDYLLCISQDITAQKQSENLLQQLFKELAEFKFALDASSIVSITDAKGVIQYVNGKFCEVSQYSTHELLGQKHSIVKSAYHSPEFFDQLWSTIASGHVWKGEICNRDKQGDLYWLESTIVPLLEETGKPNRYISINIDITEKKLLEKQFLRVQRMESLGTLAGGIAHDLNNVLAPIMMAVQLFQSQEPDDETRQWLDIVEGSAKRGADLVKQILAFSRGTSGEHTVLKLNYVIQEIRQIVEETFPKTMRLQVDAPQDLWPVRGDTTQLHQVFMNLCINARDAMPDGGHLSIRANNVTLDKDFARLHLDATPGSYVEITVTDAGTGIPLPILDRIFEPFFTTKDFGKGTGMGLSTAMGIVKSHGGFITVASTVGEGTAFSVYLPAAEPYTKATVSTQAIASGQGELILVVDDEAPICDMVRASLQSHHYRVITAHSGKDAIALYAQHADQINLVLLDMMMPEMNGLETMRAIQHLNPAVKVMVMSGLVAGLDEPVSSPDTAFAMLAKPFTTDELLLALNQTLYPHER